jgi:hypothetical protein
MFLKNVLPLTFGHIAFVVTKQYNQRQMEQHMLNRFKCTATIMAEKRMPKVYGTMHVSIQITDG